jgi:ferredoxin
MIKIEPEKCIGCGTCVALADKTFVMEGDKAIVKKEVGDDEETIKMAIDSCPTQAITNFIYTTKSL